MTPPGQPCVKAESHTSLFLRVPGPDFGSEKSPYSLPRWRRRSWFPEVLASLGRQKGPSLPSLLAWISCQDWWSSNCGVPTPISPTVVLDLRDSPKTVLPCSSFRDGSLQAKEQVSSPRPHLQGTPHHLLVKVLAPSMG